MRNAQRRAIQVENLRIKADGMESRGDTIMAQIFRAVASKMEIGQEYLDDVQCRESIPERALRSHRL